MQTKGRFGSPCSFYRHRRKYLGFLSAFTVKKVAKQARSKATINTILEAAMQILVESDYEKATTNRIAERAGFAVATLYQYFEDKEDVYRELVERELDRIAVTLEQSLPRDTLYASLTDALFAVTQPTRETPGTFYAIEPLMADLFKESRNESRERIIVALADLMAHHADELSGEDPLVAARRVVALVEGLAFKVNPAYLPSPGLEQQVMKLVMAMLHQPH